MNSVTACRNALAVSILTISFICTPAYSQDDTSGRSYSASDSSLSLEVQAYWTGVISGVTYERFFTDRDAWHVRIGYQRIRHEDFGEHDDERGDGYGGTLGYRRYWANGLSLGARVDVWQNTLDWTDSPGLDSERRGVTDVTVLQPTVEGTWRKAFSSDWFVQPSAAIGAEINVITDGEDTGEGFIVLLGISLGRNFR